MGPTPIQVVKIPRRVVVIYFFHSKYAKYMILLLVTVHSSASCRGRPTGPQNDSKHNVHSKQSSITKKKKGRPWSDDFDTLGRRVPQRGQRLLQEARIVTLRFTVKVVF